MADAFSYEVQRRPNKLTKGRKKQLIKLEQGVCLAKKKLLHKKIEEVSEKGREIEEVSYLLILVQSISPGI